jgi:hypothetical protein
MEIEPMTSSDRPDRDVPPESDWVASWETEDNYWYENFSSRPYAPGPDYYDRFRPAFRYGFESASHSLGRTWDEAEPDLKQGWERYQHRGERPAAWEEIREAVRDAWNRITGARPAGAEGQRPQIRE